MEKIEYMNLTKKEKHNAYLKKYYHKTGKIYHSIRGKCKRYGMKKEEFNGCKTIVEVNERVDLLLKNLGYSPEIIKMLTTHRRKVHSKTQ